jgi:hypothetical protein
MINFKKIKKDYPLAHSALREFADYSHGFYRDEIKIDEIDNGDYGYYGCWKLNSIIDLYTFFDEHLVFIQVIIKSSFFYVRVNSQWITSGGLKRVFFIRSDAENEAFNYAFKVLNKKLKKEKK